MEKPKLLGPNRPKNTLNLKRLMRQRKKKAALIENKLEGIDGKISNNLEIKKEIKEILSGKKQKTVHWNQQLAKCKASVLRKGGPSKDIIDIIKELDEKLEILSRVLNLILNGISVEEKKSEDIHEEILRLKESITEFTNDTLEELNSVTSEVRAFRYKEENLFFGDRDNQNREKSPNVLITTMFRLYDHDQNTKIKDLYKKKK